MIKSPITYIGSKYTLLEKLIPKFPTENDGIDTFVDLFTGGGSVYMNVGNQYGTVYANDVLWDLVKIHEQLDDSEFLDTAMSLADATKYDQLRYNDLRSEYNVSKDPAQLLALIWSCNSNMMRFNKSGEFNQTWGKRTVNRLTVNEYKNKSNKKSNVIFKSGQFDKILTFTPSMFVYLDPPYSNTGAGYNTTWSVDDDLRLIVLLEFFISNKIYFGISGCLNEKPNIIFDTLKKYDLSVTYFNDLYTKVNKDGKINNEYYITNFKSIVDEPTLEKFM